MDSSALDAALADMEGVTDITQCELLHDEMLKLDLKALGDY